MSWQPIRNSSSLNTLLPQWTSFSKHHEALVTFHNMSLYSVIGDFFMIWSLFKDVVFQIKNKINKRNKINTKNIQYDLIK